MRKSLILSSPKRLLDVPHAPDLGATDMSGNSFVRSFAGISGAVTLKDFLKLRALPRVECPVADAGLSLDMDTPEDYKRPQDSH
jgi:hypothetical protein